MDPSNIPGSEVQANIPHGANTSSSGPRKPAEHCILRLNRLACRLARVPIALVDFEQDSPEGKAAAPFVPELPAWFRSPMGQSLTERLLEGGAPLAVNDLGLATWAGTELNRMAAAASEVRSCLGVPMLSPKGRTVGILWVFDTAPREWVDADFEPLDDLAVMAMAELTREVGDSGSGGPGQGGQIDPSGPRFGAMGWAPRPVVEDPDWFALSVVDAFGARIAVIDHGGTILAVNRAWRDFAARNPAHYANACEGGNFLDICDEAASHREEGAAQFASGVRDILSGGQATVTQEYPCVQDGQRRWFLARVSPFAVQGKARAVVSHHDITEQRMAREEQERFFSIALEQLVIAGFDGRIRHVNPAVERNFGYTSEELVGREFFDLIHPDDREAAIRGLAGLAFQKPAAHHECRCLHKDGSFRWFSWMTVPVPEEGVFYSAGRDITDQKQAEEEIQRLNNQLERRLERLAALRVIDMAIASTLDSRRILEILLDQILGQLKVDAAAVLLYDRKTGSLEYTAGKGFLTDEVQRKGPILGDGWSSRAVLNSSGAIYVLDLLQSEGVAKRNLMPPEEGFRACAIIPLLAKGQVKGVLELFQRTAFAIDSEWSEYLETLAGQAAIAIDNASLFENLQRSNRELTLAYDATIEGWSHALDLRDRETVGHTKRVTELTLRLARAMDVDDEDLVHIRRGALLHDIGKMGIPDAILHKPGPLDEREQEIMRRHPTYAFDMLRSIPFLGKAIEIPYYHHEKWDGTGYPQGLKGDEIPISARIFAVADIWDALCSDRPYRKGWADTQVIEHIRGLSGNHLDPNVVRSFLEIIERELPPC